MTFYRVGKWVVEKECLLYVGLKYEPHIISKVVCQIIQSDRKSQETDLFPNIYMLLRK